MMLPCTIVVQAAEGHIHAVIVSGGMNRLMNHERYWNDCAFLYRTLRQTYNVPKRNITVLMSDGSDPEKDMLRADGLGFLSSPMDLDGDGQWDVAQAATRQTVSRTFMQLSNQLTADDSLLLFTKAAYLSRQVYTLGCGLVNEALGFPFRFQQHSIFVY